MAPLQKKSFEFVFIFQRVPFREQGEPTECLQPPKNQGTYTHPLLLVATKATHSLLEDTCLSNSLSGEATLRVSTLE